MGHGGTSGFGQDADVPGEVGAVGLANGLLAVRAEGDMVVEGPQPVERNNEGPVDAAEVCGWEDGLDPLECRKRQVHPGRRIDFAIILTRLDIGDIRIPDLEVTPLMTDKEKSAQAFRCSSPSPDLRWSSLIDTTTS